MWPINGRYSIHDQPSHTWHHAPPGQHPSFGHPPPPPPPPPVQMNSLKRSFSDRHSAYSTNSLPVSRNREAGFARSGGSTIHHSPGNQFHFAVPVSQHQNINRVPSHQDLASHSDPRDPRFSSLARSAPDEIDRQSELFAHAASSPRIWRTPSIARQSPQQPPASLSSNPESHPRAQGPREIAEPMHKPAAAGQQVTKRPDSANLSVRGQRDLSSDSASPRPVTPSVEVPQNSPVLKTVVKMPLHVEHFQAYFTKEEADMYAEYFDSGSVSLKRANHVNEVEKIDIYSNHVQLADKSPFASLSSIKVNRSPVGRNKANTDERTLSQHVFHENQTKGVEHIYSYSTHQFTAPTFEIPMYTHYVSSKHNVLVEGDKQRTFLPYLGENTDQFDEDFQILENKILDNQKKGSELHSSEEFAKPWILKIGRILDDLGTSTAAVLRFLIDESMTIVPLDLPKEHVTLFEGRPDWITDGFYEEEDDIEATKADISPKPKRPQKQWRVALENLPEVHGEPLTAAVLACWTFMEVAGFSLWHVVRLSSVAAQACKSTAPQPGLRSAQDSDPIALHAYIDQACLICKAHQCSGHGEISDDSDNEAKRIPMTSNFDADTLFESAEQVAMSRDALSNAEMHALLGQNDNGNIDGNSWTLFGDDDPGIADSQLCSKACFWKKSNRTSKSLSAKWSKGDTEYLKVLGPAYTSLRRGACALARTGVFERSCVDIFYKLVSLATTPEDAELAKQAEGHDHHNKSWKWWLDNSSTWKHDEREPFTPCNHVGKCKSNPRCSCFQQGISCEKSCNCPSVCSRRFRGCRCHATNKACIATENCDCRALNRECDPDLCYTCGAIEVLDPANRYEDKAIKNRCGNVMIQRAVPKRTQLGQSQLLSRGGISGWGLFMGEEARKGDYIGEYIGEIVTPEESEQRGIIYNAMNLSYLFDLNSKQVLDSTPIGNKLRYINHQGDDFANCQAKVMFCGGVQRIAIFATCTIHLGQELLFNYGDGFASKIDMVKLGKDGNVTIEKAKKGVEANPKTSAHKKLPNDIGKKPKIPLHLLKGKEKHVALELDGVMSEDEDPMDLDDAPDTSGDDEMGLVEDDEEEEEEDTYEDAGSRNNSSKRGLPGGMTGSDRMRKAWIARYRNLGMEKEAREQERRFNKERGKY